MENFSSKNPEPNPQPIQKRSISAFKIPSSVQNPSLSKSPGKKLTTAARLIQKRKSVEKKIEQMRKQKIEAELKEVQSKPKISSRSRKLAEKAEFKYFKGKAGDEILPNTLLMDDEDLTGLEFDIRLLEDCLNEKNKKTGGKGHVRTYEGSPAYESIFSEKNSNKGEGVKRTESLVKKIVVPAGRLLGKSNSPVVRNRRSNSVENLVWLQFGYRSLSPYQVSIKRRNED